MDLISNDPIIIILDFLNFKDIFMFGSISIQFKKIVNNYLIKNNSWIVKKITMDEEDLRLISINPFDLKGLRYNPLLINFEKILNKQSKGIEIFISINVNNRKLKMKISGFELRHMIIKDGKKICAPVHYHRDYLVSGRDIKTANNITRLIKLLMPDQSDIICLVFQITDQDYDYVESIIENMTKDIVELKKKARINY